MRNYKSPLKPFFKFAALFVILALSVCAFVGCVPYKAVTEELVDFSEESEGLTFSCTATLYIVSANENADDFNVDDFANDYNDCITEIENCIKILESREVLDAVGNSVGISRGYESLKNAVSVTNPADTRIIYVTAVADTPENAKLIVDNLCYYGKAAVKDAYNLELRAFEEGIS